VLVLANIRIALRALRVHRMRSALTMLGIVIGVAAVVAMVAIGSGARERIDDAIATLGSNLISIAPGSMVATGVRMGQGSNLRLSEDDIWAIEAEVPGIVAAAPMLSARVQFTFGASNWQGQIRGSGLGYLEAREWPMAEGRFFTPEEYEGAAKVAIIGESLRQSLFGAEDPVGHVVRIKDHPFTIIGVLARKGQSLSGEDQDDFAFVPLTTMRRFFVGFNRAYPRQIWWGLVKFAPEYDVRQVMDQIRGLLRERHRVPPDRDDSFVLRDLSEVMEMQAAASRIMATLLAAIASVSLLVGGIGIMNIMLVSVTERTREIGLRMAVGARGRDILAQFLTEAATLAFIGGVIGVALGAVVSWIIAESAGWRVLIAPETVLVAVLFSGAIGVFFGFYPARKAARLDPIAALRYE
jgi:putative ABC transport system permease protein